LASEMSVTHKFLSRL